MTETNTPQPVPTDDEILQVFADIVGNQEDDARFIDVDRDQAIRIARALLSKLRAPVADERVAFERWYTRCDTPEMAARAVQRNSSAGLYRLLGAQASWEAWQARAAQASAPIAPQACPTDVCQAGKADGVLCANDECDRANGVRPASAPVAGEARMPPGYRVKVIEGHGYRITPPTGGCWVAHSDTPAGDLITALLAAPQASEADDLVGALGQCRNAFPIPHIVGSSLDLLWQEAMSDPVAVPAYVKACATQGQASEAVLPEPCHDLRYHDQYRVGWNRCLDECRAALSAQPGVQKEQSDAD